MPANYSPSFVKNIIGRSLTSVLDPHPTKKQLRELVQHFESLCAYCAKEIHVKPKDAQLDHVDSDGPNNISNRVFACEACNEEEKRDKPWLEFLRDKCSTEEEFSNRKQTIQQWIAQNSLHYVPLSPETRKELDEHIIAAKIAFDNSVENVRSLRKN